MNQNLIKKLRVEELYRIRGGENPDKDYVQRTTTPDDPDNPPLPPPYPKKPIFSKSS